MLLFANQELRKTCAAVLLWALIFLENQKS